MFLKTRRWWAERKVRNKVRKVKRLFHEIEEVMARSGFNRGEKRTVRRDIVQGNISIFHEKD